MSHMPVTSASLKVPDYSAKNSALMNGGDIESNGGLAKSVATYLSTCPCRVLACGALRVNETASSFSYQSLISSDRKCFLGNLSRSAALDNKERGAFYI